MGSQAGGSCSKDGAAPGGRTSAASAQPRQAKREAPVGPRASLAAGSRLSRAADGRRAARSQHLRRLQQLPATPPRLAGCNWQVSGQSGSAAAASNCVVCFGGGGANAARAEGGHEGAANCRCLSTGREQSIVLEPPQAACAVRLIAAAPTNTRKHDREHEQHEEQHCALIGASSAVASEQDQAALGGRPHHRPRQRLSTSSGGGRHPAGALPAALLAASLSPRSGFMGASSEQQQQQQPCSSSACCESGCHPDRRSRLDLAASYQQPTQPAPGNARRPALGVGGPYACSRQPADRQPARAGRVGGGGAGSLRNCQAPADPLTSQQPAVAAAGATCTHCTVPVAASSIGSAPTRAASATPDGSAAVTIAAEAAAASGSTATNTMSLQVGSCAQQQQQRRQQQPGGQSEESELAGEQASPDSQQKVSAAVLPSTHQQRAANASNSLSRRHHSRNSHSKSSQQQQQQQCYFVDATKSEILDNEQQRLKDSQPYVTTATAVESTDTTRPAEGSSGSKQATSVERQSTISEHDDILVAADSPANKLGTGGADQRKSSAKGASSSNKSAKLSPNAKQAQLAAAATKMGGSSNHNSGARGERHFQQQHKDPPGNAYWDHMDWKGISRRYGKMPRQSKGRFWWRARQSCLCQLLFSSLEALFPILGSFKSYALPGDFIADIVAGFTIAVLHIPQGMAYGLLAGVEPIYGLYVSFVPVLIMALMSKSRHVSYGTFAVISMLLVNATESVKELLKQQVVTSTGQLDGPGAKVFAEPLTSPPSSSLSSLQPTATSQQRQQQQQVMAGNELGGLVLTNNHQQPSATESIQQQQQQQQQLLLRNLLTPSVASQAGQTETAELAAVERAIGLLGLNLNSSLVDDGQRPAPLVAGAGSPPIEASSSAASLWLLAAEAAPTDGVGAATAAGVASVASSLQAAVSTSASVEFIMPTNIEILTCICILVGLIQMCMALMRLGILSLMFSDQLVSSFTTASAIHVVTSQIGGLFDMNLPPVAEGTFRVCRVWWVFAQKLTEGFNQYTALLSLASVLFLLAVKEILEPLLRRRFKSLTCLPSELILMSFLIFSSWYFEFNEVYDIRIIGNVPTGLPAPQIPRLELAPLMIEDSLTVALVSFAMNLSLAQVYAKRYRYTMDPNQELFALGTANFVSSFFSCFPCASSLSRSAVQSNLNVKSQLCSLFSCAIVVAIICYFAPILHDLPRSTLCCIIIVALKGILVQVKDLYENWRLSKLDAFVWIATFLSVLAFGVTYGLALGIVASLFMIFFRLLTPNHSILGQLPGTEIYVDSNAFVDCSEIEQVKIFRFNSALCYLNRTMFKSRVEKSLPSIYPQKGFNLFCSTGSAAPTTETNLKATHNGLAYSDDSNSDNKVKFLVIDCSALAYCDYSGAATLVEIVEELEENKLHVYLAACPLKLIDMIEKMQKTRVLEHNVYPSITDAVNHAKYLRCKTIMLQQRQVSSSSLPAGLPSSAASPINLIGGSFPGVGGGSINIDAFN